MSRPVIKTTPEEFESAVSSRNAASAEPGFIANFYGPTVRAINSHDETVRLQDDDLQIAKVNAALYEHGFELIRISDQDSEGNCDYRIVVRELPE
jgi:hypothetical protein